MTELQTANLPFVRDLAGAPHQSWRGFLLNSDTASALDYARGFIDQRTNSTPAPCNVLRFLCSDLMSAKVVILGQDPYPQPGAATGRCFEVGTLTSWEDSFRNVSLKNIVRALYAAPEGKVLTYREVLARAAQGWPLLPPHRLFRDWEAQGVLLLNTAFTCEIGAAGSHTEYWKPFTELLLRYISQTNAQLIWFVWGKHAERHTAGLPIAHKMVSQHPMMCYEGQGRSDDFLFGQTNMFRETAHLVQWNGSASALAERPRQGLFY